MDILRSFDMFGMQPKYFRASPFFSLLFCVFLLYVSTIFLAILLIVFSMWIWTDLNKESSPCGFEHIIFSRIGFEQKVFSMWIWTNNILPQWILTKSLLHVDLNTCEQIGFSMWIWTHLNNLYCLIVIICLTRRKRLCWRTVNENKWIFGLEYESWTLSFATVPSRADFFRYFPFPL